jgi:nitrate reductase (cytochrome), electron transfer subunit
MRHVWFWIVAVLLVGTLVLVTTWPGLHRAEPTQITAPTPATTVLPSAAQASSTSVAQTSAAANNTPIATNLDAMRRGVPIDQESTPLAMARVDNSDIRRERAYPMQPPTIPHSIDNYEVDKNYNRCLMCHTRSNAAKFQAPAISVTHYLDRGGHVLAQIAPRRYFCIQCHVVQTDAKPLVANTFKDEQSVIDATTKNGP